MNGAGNGSILVVDDHHSSLKLMTDVLIAEGYDVRSADGGEIALASAISNPPDLILLDMIMPGMDGLEVFRRLQEDEHTEGVPVIFATASTDLERRVEGLKLGAADYITKPFERTELLARVAAQIKLHRLRVLSDGRALSENAQADAAMALLGCQSKEEVYEVIGDFMLQLVPGAVILVNETTPDDEWLITRKVAGLDDSLLLKVAALVGFDMVGKRWPFSPAAHDALLSGTLSRVEGGLGDIAPGEIPPRLADSLVSAIGLHDVYAIGIADRASSVGGLLILTRAADCDLPTYLIESFARHCFSTLTGISTARDLAEKAQGNSLLLGSMTEGLALHEIVLDEAGAPCDYRFLDVNPAFEKMTGLKAHDIVGRTAREVMPDVDPMLIGQYGTVAMTGVAARLEDHSTVPGRHHDVVAYSPQPGRFATVVSDVTERDLAEDELRQSERWLSESQRVAELGHYIYEIERDYWDGSQSLYDVLGIDETHDTSFEGWIAIVHPDDRERLSRYFAEEVLGKKLPFDIEYRIIRPRDGVERWVHGLGNVEFREDGSPVAMFGVIQDVNERRESECELERREAWLEELLRERESNLEQLESSLSSIIEVVGQVVEARDPYTAGHQRRVSQLAVRISEEMDLPAEDIEQIRVAALLHDVGKISVPAEILSKPGKLSAVEFELIKSHSEDGFRIISSAHMAGPTAEIVYQHHERCDGSGYPRGLTEDDLLEGAKVLMVADVVEAMSSHRPYRASLGMGPALAEVERGSGVQYDTAVADACKRAINAGFVFSES